MYSMLVTEGANEWVSILGVYMTSQFMWRSCKKFLDSTTYGKYNSEHIWEFFSKAYEMVYMKNYNKFNYTYIMEKVLVTCLKFYS